MTRYQLGFLLIAGMAWGQPCSLKWSKTVSEPIAWGSTDGTHGKSPTTTWTLTANHKVAYMVDNVDGRQFWHLYAAVTGYNSAEFDDSNAAKKEAERLACIDDRILNSTPDYVPNLAIPRNPGCPDGFICELYRSKEQAENWSRQWHDDGILKPAPGNLVGGRIDLPIPEEIHPCSATPNKDATDKARLEVMQKALDYIAKMAARNPKEEQDAGEFLEKMGRILAGSEGK